MTVPTEIVGPDVSLQAKQQRVSTTLAASATSRAPSRQQAGGQIGCAGSKRSALEGA